jgi:NAD+ kinase
VVVHKTSRLKFEQMKRPDLTEREIASMLVEGGVDYEYLRERHRAHTQSLAEIQSYLNSRGCTVHMTNRESFSEEDVHWADLLIAAGGDGNFLFTASKVHSPDKLLVGVNTDPYKSEGFLCLNSGLSPSQSGSSSNVIQLLSGVFGGEYSEVKRQRIRVTLGSRQLPVKALNEVFVGERDVSHSSYYEFSHDGSPSERQKSSGLLVYTGSGSTSWAYNMNKISSDTVQSLLQIASKQGVSLPPHITQQQLAEHVSEVYNTSNVFDEEALTMAYTVREPIIRGIFAVSSTHGYAKSVTVVSRSWDANLVLDGHYCADFPNGSAARLNIHDSDSLRTLRNNRSKLNSS